MAISFMEPLLPVIREPDDQARRLGPLPWDIQFESIPSPAPFGKPHSPTAKGPEAYASGPFG